MGRSRSVMGSVALVLLLLQCAAGAEDKSGKKPEAAPVATITIPLAQLGYRGTPSAGLLETRASIMTLDFLDSNHVLFTYAIRPLMQRQSEPDKPEHTDRMVHAEVVELPDGKLITETDWRLHDRRPYLWAVGSGDFLLRIGGNLSLVDRNLKMSKVVDTQSPIRWVQADAGCNLVIVEVEREQHSEEQHRKLAHDALLFNAPEPAEDYETYGLEFHVGQDAAQELFHLHLPKSGPLTANDEWLLQEHAASAGSYEITALPLGKSGEKHSVLKMKSDCRPGMLMLSHDVAMVSACETRGLVEYGVTTAGKTLWKQKVDEPVWPNYVRSGNGARFAVQKVSRRHEDEKTAGEAEVFDVATGLRMFSTPMAPLYSTEHAVALSPDGLRLALLRDGAMEIFELPPVAPPAVSSAAPVTAAVQDDKSKTPQH